MEEKLVYSHDASDTKQALNTIIQFVLNGILNTKALIQSFTAIRLNNPILQSRYTIDSQGRPCRVTSDNVADARYLVGDEWNDNKMQALADTPFDLARHQLLRVVIWDRGDNKKEEDALRDIVEVEIINHYIITDRASFSLMLESLSHHYRRVQAQTLQDGATITPLGSKQKPGSRQISYAGWSHWLHIHKHAPREQMQLQEKMAFWRKTLGSMRRIRILSTVHRHDHLDSCNETATNPGACQQVSIPCPDKCVDAPYSQRLAVAATALALRAIFGISDVALASYDKKKAKVAGGFSGRDIYLEIIIDGQITKLVDAMRRKHVGKNTVDFADIGRFFILDVITRLAYGKEFGWVEADEDLHGYGAEISKFAALGALISDVT